MRRRSSLFAAAAMLGAAALGSSSSRAHVASASAHTPPRQNPSPLLATPVKLDRRSAQLRLVQVVFRHGARTPLSDEAVLWDGHEWNVAGQAFVPVPIQLVDVNGGPPSENSHDLKQRAALLPGGSHKGELTVVGQLQGLELGYWLRQQYIDTHGFLPATFHKGVLCARTTNFSRTKATMASVLTGLFPGTSEAIPVVTSGDLDEILYADTKRCPHLKVLMTASEAQLKAAWQSPAEAPRVQALQQQLSRVFKLPEGAWDRRWMMCDVHDAITSLAAHGKELPAGLTREMRDEVDRLATDEIKAFISPALVDDHGHTVLRLSMGRLLDTLLANMDAAARHAATSSSSQQCSSAGEAGGGGQQEPKLRLFSGHDSTLMPLLAVLSADVERWPPYISSLVMELWELTGPPPPQPSASTRPTSSSDSGLESSPGPFVVRVLFNKQPLELPGATSANPHLLELHEFRHRVLSPFILSEAQHAEACTATISHDSALPQPEGAGEEDWSLAGGSAAAGGAGAAQAQDGAAKQQQAKL